MTTQALSDRPSRGFFNGAYFLGELRRSWSSCLLYFLAYFFLLTVPMLDDLASYRGRDFYDTVTTRELEYYIPAMYVAIAMACAAWAGFMACGYLNKRVSAYHFHSMPIRREGMLLVKTAVAYADFLIALIPNLILSMIMAAIIMENPVVLLLLGLYCLLGFTLAYTFTLLCGMVCGTRSFHVIFTGIVAFIGPAMLSAVYTIPDSVCRFLDTDFICWEGKLFYYSSPFLYTLERLGENGKLSAAGILGLIAISLVCMAGALVLVRIRPTEGAETSVVFRPIAIVLKYIIMALSSIFLGYFFGEIFSSDGFWIYFGMVSGAVLSFMLMNVLIHRNVRKMFSGLVGFVVFAVVFSGVCWGTSAAFTYRDTHGYAREDILSVAVADHHKMAEVFIMTDPAVIDAVVAYTDAYLAEMRVRLEDDGKDIRPITYAYEIPETTYVYVGDDARPVDLGYSAMRDAKVMLTDSRTIYISQTTKWGTRTWRLNFDHVGALDALETELCRAVADSAEFKEAYIDTVLSPWGRLYNEIRDLAEGINWSNIDGETFIANSATFAAIEAELREQLCYDFFQQPWVAEVECLSASGYWFDIPIFESQTILLAAIGEPRTPQQVLDDYVAKYHSAEEEDILCGVNVDPASGAQLGAVYIERDDPMFDIILRNASNLVNYRDAFFLTRLDRSYAFAAVNNGRSVRFISGRVPQSVIDLFK